MACRTAAERPRPIRVCGVKLYPLNRGCYEGIKIGERKAGFSADVVTLTGNVAV